MKTYELSELVKQGIIDIDEALLLNEYDETLTLQTVDYLDNEVEEVVYFSDVENGFVHIFRLEMAFVYMKFLRQLMKLFASSTG